ncbi:MAG: flap endonuclease [Gammaproteobacteria bacterium]|jgi:5'-3' exonuclease|nr:flap endonuclease [Gammaproteobacteria bacterium]
MPLPRAYLIDSSIYIFRAWFVYDDSITDSKGNPSNAVFGFSDFLYQLIRQKKPEFIACAFDSSQTDSYRKGLYPEYKANRDPAPEELKVQFQHCRDFCHAVGIPHFGSDRFEADDIIGSLAQRLREQGMAVTIVSADKDLTQLVLGEEDAWWDFARGNVLNSHGVKKQFGVRPDQIADMLALTGDKVDNIPGIPGVGYTTASRILQKFASVEDVIANVEQISDMKFRGSTRVQALVNAHKEMLPLNKLLTTIVTDMDFDEEPDLCWNGINEDALREISDLLALSDTMHQRWLNLD